MRAYKLLKNKLGEFWQVRDTDKKIRAIDYTISLVISKLNLFSNQTIYIVYINYIYIYIIIIYTIYIIYDNIIYIWKKQHIYIYILYIILFLELKLFCI